MTFDISDASKRYNACPMCKETTGMWLTTRKGMRYVKCVGCSFCGPEINEGEAECDRMAFDGWNASSCQTEVTDMQDLSVGMLVRWEWTDRSAGMSAVSKGIRPVGKVVDRESFPNMSCEIGVSCLDDRFWVIDPREMFKRGRRFYV